MTDSPRHGRTDSPSLWPVAFCALLLLPTRIIHESQPDWRPVSWLLGIEIVALMLLLVRGLRIGGRRSEDGGRRSEVGGRPAIHGPPTHGLTDLPTHGHTDAPADPVRPSVRASVNPSIHSASFTDVPTHRPTDVPTYRRTDAPSLLRFLAFPILFILVAIPWPYQIEQGIIQSLTRLNARVAVTICDIVGVTAIQEGNVIEVGTGQVGLDEACSGIRSLQLCVMLALFFGEVYRLTVVRRLLLLAVGIGLALICNLARTVLLVWIADQQSINAMNRWHDLSGTLIIMACFTAVWGCAAWWRDRRWELEDGSLGGKGGSRKLEVGGRRSEAGKAVIEEESGSEIGNPGASSPLIPLLHRGGEGGLIGDGPVQTGNQQSEIGNPGASSPLIPLLRHGGEGGLIGDGPVQTGNQQSEIENQKSEIPGASSPLIPLLHRGGEGGLIGDGPVQTGNQQSEIGNPEASSPLIPLLHRGGEGGLIGDGPVQTGNQQSEIGNPGASSPLIPLLHRGGEGGSSGITQELKDRMTDLPNYRRTDALTYRRTAIAIIALIAFSELTTEAYYRYQESRAAARMLPKFVVHWPTNDVTVRKMEIPERTASMLGYDRGELVAWEDPGRGSWQVFSFEWLPGRPENRGAYHPPTVCIPATGRKLRAELPATYLKTAALPFPMPFDTYEFLEDDGRSLFLFHGIWEDRVIGRADAKVERRPQRIGRLEQVLEGRRNKHYPGVRVILAGVWGFADVDSAVKAFQERFGGVLGK